MAHSGLVWPEFNRELADKLAGYAYDREALAERVSGMLAGSGVVLPEISAIEDPVGLDPFAVYALLYAPRVEEATQRLLAKAKDVFNLRSDVPQPGEPLPLMVPPGSCAFFSMYGDEARAGIGKLWLLFEGALSYAGDPSIVNEEVFKACFDAAAMAPGMQSKLTLGLFWMRPDFYMDLSTPCQWYIFRENALLRKWTQDMSDIDTKPLAMSASQYLALMFDLEQLCQEDGSPFRSFVDIALDARNAWKADARTYGGIEGSATPYGRYARPVHENGYGPDWSGAIAGMDDGKPGPDEQDLPDQDEPDEMPAGAFLLMQDADGYGYDGYFADVYMDQDLYEDIVALLRARKNIVLQGPAGAGKSYAATRLAASLAGTADEDHVCMLNFHDAYQYGDFLMAYHQQSNVMELKEAPFALLCDRADTDPDGAYFFIMDGMDRGDVDKVLGELAYLLEADRRFEALEVLYTGEEFSIPPNVFFVGTLDTANGGMPNLSLRRRFAFVDMEPAFNTHRFRQYAHSLDCDAFYAVVSAVQEINADISADPKLGRGCQIGHSYFCGLTSEDADEMLQRIVRFELVPLIEQLWRHDARVRDCQIRKLETALKDAGKASQ